jgi:hypothetical protein
VQFAERCGVTCERCDETKELGVNGKKTARAAAKNTLLPSDEIVLKCHQLTQLRRSLSLIFMMSDESCPISSLLNSRSTTAKTRNRPRRFSYEKNHGLSQIADGALPD